jgi:hypothetical protein
LYSICLGRFVKEEREVNPQNASTNGLSHDNFGFWDFSRGINSRYASEHGYDYRAIVPDMATRKSITTHCNANNANCHHGQCGDFLAWAKLLAVAGAVNQEHGNSPEWLLFLDSDAWVTDLSLSFKDILKKLRFFHNNEGGEEGADLLVDAALLITGKGPPYWSNTGVQVWHNSPLLTRQLQRLLREWYCSCRYKPYDGFDWEQKAMRQYVRMRAPLNRTIFRVEAIPSVVHQVHC